MAIAMEIVQVLSVIYTILALYGAYLVVYTIHKAKKGMDSTVLRARAFLNQTFLMDNWKLLFLICLLSIINAITEIDEVFGFTIEEGFSTPLSELTEVGIISCAVILAYKWSKFVIHDNSRKEFLQEAHSGKGK